MTEQLISVREFATEHFNLDPDRVTALAGAGSDRQYFRLIFPVCKVIGTWSENTKENEAFFYLADTLHAGGVAVPRIIAVDRSRSIYLQEDCGSYDAYSLLAGQDYKIQKPWLKKIIDRLVHLQLEGSRYVDYLRCYPSAQFGYSDVLHDLHYFERYFLGYTDIPYDRKKLWDDFGSIALRVEKCRFKGFMYRDFQSRNIMIDGETIYFIDFQGARRGPCVYDLISLLYQARLGLRLGERKEMEDYYISRISSEKNLDGETLRDDLNAVLPVRLLQVLGAYGRRGLMERKSHFISSISPAIDNLALLTDENAFVNNHSELSPLLQQIIESKEKILCLING